MNTYVITLSKVFPSTHPRKGKETQFNARFQNALMCAKCRETKNGMCMGECAVGGEKLHTIRANYELWASRFEQIAAGKACLSIRQWTGAPYRSKQVELARLTAEDGVGIQELKMIDLSRPTKINGHKVELPDLAKNDGLEFNDWFNWFRGYDLSKPLAIIHFTKFRY